MGLLLPDLSPLFPAKPPPAPGPAALTPPRRRPHLPAVWGWGQCGPRLQFRPHGSRETCFHKRWLRTSCGSIGCSGAIIFVVGLEKKNLGVNSAGDPSVLRVLPGCAARVPAPRTQSAHNDARARSAHGTAACEMPPKPRPPPARSSRPCARSHTRSGDLRAGAPEPTGPFSLPRRPAAPRVPKAGSQSSGCGLGGRVGVPRTQPVLRSNPPGPLRQVFSGAQRGLVTCRGPCSVVRTRTQAEQVPAHSRGARSALPCPTRRDGRVVACVGGASLLWEVCGTHSPGLGLQRKAPSCLFLGFIWGPVGKRPACAGSGRSWIRF